MNSTCSYHFAISFDVVMKIMVYGLAQFSYIWDYDNLLEEKDSPYDKGQEVFEELYRNRIKVR